ncbi:MAG: hypothetical protein HRT57_15995 [Crocinitomicaceae bacterium]|nr:hypothetical protein [Crocinitomicaceae bacterium]
MSALDNPLFTRTLIGATTFTLLHTDGIGKYSIKVVTGTCTILGTKSIRGIISDAVTLEEGQVFNGSSQNASCCFTLTVPPASVVELVASNN